MKSLIDNWKIIILLTLTLGLAPFFPEPHVWGKIKWIAGGAVNMGFTDWFDLIFHGLPFVLLLRLLVIHSLRRGRKGKGHSTNQQEGT